MRAPRKRLHFEELESRVVPSTFYHGTLPNTNSTIGLFSDQIATGLSSQMVKFIATHFAGAQKLLPSQNAQFAADNPNWVLLNYKLATETGPVSYIHNGTWGSDWSTVNANESWFMHDPSGARFFNSGDDWYLNDITNPQFQQYWINNVLGDLQTNGAQGVFADSFEAGIGPGWWPNSDPRFNGIDSAVPADWPGGQDWLALLHNYSGAIENALHAAPQHYFYIPNVGPQVTSWASQDFSNVDGIFLEAFGQWGGGYQGATSDWVLGMNRALPVAADGQIVIMQPYLLNPLGTTAAQHQVDYDVGTYLLLKGDYTYINVFSENQGYDPSYFPQYTLPLGAPLSATATNVSQYAWNGLYRRDFQNGFVLVNPGTSAVTVNLGGNFQQALANGGGVLSASSLDANGNYVGGSLSYQTVNSVTVQPGDAAFLFNQTASVGTSVGLTSSTSTSKFGQSVTFTATVSSSKAGAGVPAGVVTFLDGTTSLGTGTLSNGAATFSTSSLAVGGHSITAVYGGGGGFTGSTSSALGQTVGQDGSSVAIASSASPSVYGQSVTFTAAVAAAAPGSGTPTGTVTFLDGTSTLGTGTLSGGKATFSTSSLALGGHSITVTYGGSGNFTGSSSSATTQMVGQDGTSVMLSSSVNPSSAGQSVTFTASVSAVAPGSGTVGGSVTFLAGSSVLGTVNLSGGSASLTTSALPVGSDTITATYNGATNYKNASAGLTQSVGTTTKAASSTTLSSGSNSSVYGQPVTFTAKVTATSGTPTGTVSFMQGTTLLGTASLANGAATFTYAGLNAGTQSVTAVYGGSTAYSGSTSAAWTQTVTAAITTTTLMVTPASATTGQLVTLKASVAAQTPGGGTATGTVYFLADWQVVGQASLSGGVATFQTSALSAGTHSLRAVWMGHSNMNGSLSWEVILTVNPAAAPAVAGARLATVNAVATVGSHATSVASPQSVASAVAVANAPSPMPPGAAATSHASQPLPSSAAHGGSSVNGDLAEADEAAIDTRLG